MRYFLLMLTLLYTLNAADNYEGDVYADEAYEMAKKGEAIIVDVRTTIEFIYTGHGEGFINIPAFYWTYDEKNLDSRVQSAQYELKTGKVKDHKAVQKLYAAKEVKNENFVKDVMKAMKQADVNKVILVCRSGPRSKAAANLLASQGIKAYNLEDGFMFGWKEENMPWGGH